MNIADRIQSLRKSKGISQEQLAINKEKTKIHIIIQFLHKCKFCTRKCKPIRWRYISFFVIVMLWGGKR